MGRRFTPEEYKRQNALIRQYAGEGKALSAIAKLVGLPANTVGQRMTRLKIPGLSRATQKKVPTTLNPTKTVTYRNITLPALSFLEKDDVQERVVDDTSDLYRD